MGVVNKVSRLLRFISSALNEDFPFTELCQVSRRKYLLQDIPRSSKDFYTQGEEYFVISVNWNKTKIGEGNGTATQASST